MSNDDPTLRLSDVLRQHERDRTELEASLTRYEIRGELGHGGLGVVYAAWDRKLQRDVAIKLLHPHLESIAEARARFQREWRAAAQLGHPNLVTVLDAGESNGRMYLVMERVEGETLHRVLADRGWELRSLVRLLEKAARGAHFAHERGIVHRDLTPSNILVTPSGEPKVTDFGLAHLVANQTGPSTGSAGLGTPAYMAPEQVQGGTITAATDVYALGAVLYEMASGRPPYSGGKASEIFGRILTEDPAPLRRIRPSIPREVETIASKALDKEPARRYATAQDFADDLARWLAGSPILARPLGFGTRLRRWIARHRWTAAAGLAAAGGVLAIFLPNWKARERDLAQHRAKEEAAARARPRLDAGRALCFQLDRLLTTKDWTPEAARDLATRARAEFAKALDEDPRNPEALLETSRTYALEGARPSALEFCTKAIDAGPTFATAYLERAVLRLEAYEEMRHESMGRVRDEDDLSRNLRSEIEEDLGQLRRWSQDQIELLYGAGMLEFADGKFPSAADLLGQYVGRNPSDPRGWRWLGHARHHVAGQDREALEALNRALEYRPRDPVALQLRGLVRKGQGDLDGAIADYTEALRAGPPGEVLVNRANAYATKGDWDAAIADFGEAIRLRPQHARALLGRGKARAAKREFEAALGDLTEALLHEPRMPEIHSYRGAVRYELHDYDGAIADFTEALRLNPRNIQSLIERATARAAKDEFDGAVADLTEALRVEPRDATLHCRRGNVRTAARDFAAALPDFAEALRLDPQYAEAYAGRAAARQGCGDRVGAREDCEAALKFHPRLAMAYVQRAFLHWAAKDYDAAIADFEEAMRIRPEQADLYYNRGSVYIDKGDDAKAVADLTESLRRNSLDPKAHLNRGLARLNLRDYDGAAADFTELIRLRPGSTDGYLNRGVAYMRGGKTEMAIEDYSKVIELRPRWGTPY